MMNRIPILHVALLLLLISTGGDLLAQAPRTTVDALQMEAVGPRSLIAEEGGNSSSPLSDIALPLGQASQLQSGPASSARTTTLTPVGLGRASNVFSSIRTQQNQIYANDSLNLVGFIHRQDISIWGGGGASNGIFRYDISVDNGQSFNTDIGILNPSTASPGRYPNLSLINPGNQISPFASKFVYSGATTVSGSWNGMVTGVADVNINNPLLGPTENYAALSNANIPGSLAPGLSGEFWMASLVDSSATSILDSVKLLKGVYNTTTQDVEWGLYANLPIAWNRSVSGSANAVAPMVSFSPDGQFGWVGMLGDMNGGSDSIFNPIFFPSTDGGITWGAPIEMDLNASIPWLSDSLRLLWEDSLGNPASSGKGTCAFEFDLTVDNLGNPHMAVVVGSASGTNSNGTPAPINNPYSILSGLSKYLVDITTVNGGANFTASVVSPVCAFRGEFGGTNPVSMDNYPQIARNETGDRLFYSWVDSDTTTIGFGISDQLAPNLYISSLRLVDGYRTCNRGVTNGDFVWEGRVLFPTMAPTVLTGAVNGFTCYSMPIVVTEMLTNDPLQPVRFWYFGNEATFGVADYTAPGGVSIAFGTACQTNGCGFPVVNSSIEGTVYLDDNANGIQDANELGKENVMVQASPGPWYTLTDSNGHYSLPIIQGTYDLEMVLPLYHSATAPVSAMYNNVVLTAGVNLTGQNFGVKAQTGVIDLRAFVAAPMMQVGFNACHTIGVTNLGTTTQNGTVYYQFDTAMSYLSSAPLYTSFNGMDSLTWDFTNLAPLQTELHYACFNLNSNFSLGNSFQTVAEVIPLPNEIDITNNKETLTIVPVGAYDPNDKLVSPLGTGPMGIVLAGQWLTYQIRFQNTGTAAAVNVEIRDSLDQDFDITSIDMIGASHPYRMEMSGHGNVTWFFDNINLPDSTTDFAGSQGFVKFRIQTPPSTALGTDFNNWASIYFDFNAPIVTNKTQNRVDFVQSNLESVAQMEMTVFPNPFSECTEFRFDHYNHEVYAFELYDLQGRLLKSERKQSKPSYRLERGGMEAGLYFYRFEVKGQTVATGKLIVH